MVRKNAAQVKECFGRGGAGVNTSLDRNPRCVQSGSQLKVIYHWRLRVPSSLAYAERDVETWFGILRYCLQTDTTCDTITAYMRGSSEGRPPQVYLLLDRLLEYIIDRGIVILPLGVAIYEDFCKEGVNGTPVQMTQQVHTRFCLFVESKYSEFGLTHNKYQGVSEV
jgi:hypothetical protein